MEQKSIFKRVANYKELHVYQKSEVLVLLTDVFCKRFLPPYGDRRVDQMNMAARCGKQNIVEGCEDGQTSSEMEVRLVNVGRSSFQELREDYEDYLKRNNLPLWDKTHPRFDKMVDFCRVNNDWSAYKPLSETLDAEEFCNMALTLCHITDKQHMSQIIVGVVLVLDIGLDGGIGRTSGAGAHDGGVDATGLLPVDEVGHRADEVVVTYNEQVAFLIQRGVFGHASLIVNEVTLIDALEVGVHLHRVAATGWDGVLTIFVHLVHLHRHVVVDAEGLGDGVIGEGVDHHVLATEVADDVRIIEVHIACRKECVLIVAFAVGERHRGRVDGTGEVAL